MRFNLIAHAMKLFKDSLKLLRDKSYFEHTLDAVYAVALIAGLFMLIGYFFIYKPIVLLFILIAGMLIMGWFMLAVLFPDLHEQIQVARRWLMQLFR